jgi:hypothetical protein
LLNRSYMYLILMLPAVATPGGRGRFGPFEKFRMVDF